jgi:WD40 repeat protein
MYIKGKLAAKEGSFTIIGCKDYKIYHEGKDSDEPIRVVMFSPNGLFLAIGAEDGFIYLYNTKEKFMLVRKMSIHKAPITHLDFSVDGSFIMTVDTTLRIKYCETLTGHCHMSVFFMYFHMFNFRQSHTYSSDILLSNLQ